MYRRHISQLKPGQVLARSIYTERGAVLTGKYRGWRGVVSELAPSALNQPSIRLLLDDRGDRVPTPVELVLRIQDDLKIRGLAPGDAPFELGVAV